MRDRLIEILDRYGDDISFCERCERPAEDCEGCKNEQLAEFLLANSVIVPPCKVGDTVYIVGAITQTIIKQIVTEVFYDVNGLHLATSGCLSVDAKQQIGKTVFLTREAAEQTLKVGEEDKKAH